jgi:hypothetical protein
MGNLSIRAGSANPIPHTSIKLFENKIVGMGLGESYGEKKFDDLEVRGCVITSTITHYIDSGSTLFSNNILSGSLNLYNPTELVLTDNIFKFYSSLSFTNNSTTEPVILSNNLFINNYSSGSVNFNGNEFNVNNCLTYNYGSGEITFGGTGTLTENNNLYNTNPLFTNVDPSVSRSMAGTSSYLPSARLEDDYTLQTSSPALTLGVSGDEIGLFASGYLYKNLGQPSGVPTLEVLTYDGAVAKDGNINVTVRAKAN